MPVVSCSCGKKYKVSDEAAGKKIRCKDCGESIAVPRAKASSPVKKPAKPAGDDLDWDDLSSDELSGGDAVESAPPPPRRGSSAGRAKASTAKSQGGGANPLKMIFGVLAILLGVTMICGAIYGVVNGHTRRAGGGVVAGIVVIGVGWKWVRNQPVD